MQYFDKISSLYSQPQEKINSNIIARPSKGGEGLGKYFMHKYFGN